MPPLWWIAAVLNLTFIGACAYIGIRDGDYAQAATVVLLNALFGWIGWQIGTRSRN